MPHSLGDQFDPSDATFIADPYPQLAALRDAAPIFWHEASSKWIVTRHALVQATLRDRRLGRAYHHRYTDEQFGQPDADPRWARFHAAERWSLLNLEPPDHTRLRGLVAKVFTPTAVAALRPRIVASAQRFVDRVVAQGTFDLIADYAQPYSVEVICDMLGVPRGDGPLLLGWSHAMVKMYELHTTDDQRVAADRAAGEFCDYVGELIAAKRRAPDECLVSQLVAVEESGDRLTPDEILSTVIVLLNAGHEATVNTLGNGMRAFMLHREQWQRLVSGDVAPRTAVEEMLRWDAPLQLFERWVLDDGVAIGGQQLPIGANVALLFGAANRDPAQFRDPDVFDAGRGATTHVGFGGGIHFCVGAPLARMELEISLTALVRAAPHLQLVAMPEYHPTFVIRGLTGLQLRIAG